MTTHQLMMNFLPYLLPLVVALVSRVVLLILALWFMLKAQDLPYTIPAMIGSAVFASVFDLIPFVGHPMAAAVLLICVLKMTRSHLVDVRFTVGISYAVTFLLQMVILSVLPGDLRVHAWTPEPDLGQSAMEQAAMADDETEADEEAAAKAKPAETKTNAVVAEKAPVPALKAAPENPVTLYPTVDQATIELAKSLKLKGVVHNAHDSTIMIGAGGKTYSMNLGESITLKTATGPIDLKVEQITADSALINVGGKLTPLVLK